MISFDISFDIAFDGEVTFHFTAQVHEYVTETVTQLPTRAKSEPAVLRSPQFFTSHEQHDFVPISIPQLRLVIASH